MRQAKHYHIEKYLAYLRQERHLSDNTVASYGYDLDRLERFAKVERISVDQLGRRQIEAYVRELKNKDKLMNPVPFNMIKAIYFKLGITEDSNWDIYNDKYNSKD